MTGVHFRMMRAFLAGLILALVPSAAYAQATGSVGSLGFGSCYRPNCWTPMFVTLNSQLPTSANYQIQVVQEDLDKDTVTFARDITLSAGATENYWVYFVPQPTDGGLPKSPAELQKVLKVYLSTRPDSNGHSKQLLRLPLSLSMLNNLDPSYGPMEPSKGRKLILCVSDGSSQPLWEEYEHAAGIVEQPVIVRVNVADLPENVLGYDAVDSILWLSSKADKLEEAGSRRKEAIEQFIRNGGQLVVCAPAEPHDIDALADLLPIDPASVTMADHKTLQPLWNFTGARLANGRRDKPLWNHWAEMGSLHPFKFAKATPVGNAVVQDWIDWPEGKPNKTPWLVRRGIGLGSVTWVAQDLGDPALRGVRDLKGGMPNDSAGWPYIWDHVFGWNNATRLGSDDDDEMKKARALFDNSTSTIDLGKSLFGGTTFEGKGAGLMGIAIAFFIVYWIVAGPGSFLFLANKGRKEWSWFIFGAAAIVAAGITVLLVRLVLRGDPVVQHMSIVQLVPGEHARVRSRIGLYIPRDGIQTIELSDTASDSVSTLTALAQHPQDISDNEFPAAQDYTIPVHDGDQPVAVKIPFRSTLKKIEARWVGDLPGGILGSPKILGTRNGFIGGALTNQTGYDLRNVYFAFNHPQNGNNPADWVLYVPVWKNGQNLELSDEFSAAKSRLSGAEPDGKKGNVKGPLDYLWAVLWYQWVDKEGGDDSGGRRFSFPIMSLIDRLPPPAEGKSGEAETHSFDVLRRGGRDLNLSGAVASGELVIIGEASGTPLPSPVKVDGQKMTGEGTTLYQAVLPLDRTDAEQAPTTQAGS